MRAGTFIAVVNRQSQRLQFDTSLNRQHTEKDPLISFRFAESSSFKPY